MISLTILTVVGCSKDKKNDPVSKTIKYEITTTSPVDPMTNSYVTKVWYIDETGNTGTGTFTSGTLWEKTVKLTTKDRTVLRLRSDAIFLQSSGSATAKIFVDGVLKVSISGPTATYGGYTKPQVEMDEITYEVN